MHDHPDAQLALADEVSRIEYMEREEQEAQDREDYEHQTMCERLDAQWQAEENGDIAEILIIEQLELEDLWEAGDIPDWVFWATRTFLHVCNLSNMPRLRVIGAGIARTGTWALHDALEELQMGKCYHMLECRRRDQSRWAEAHCAALADDGEACGKLLSSLLDGYQCAVDFPSALYWEQLFKACPEAKVILTVRDSPEEWYQSVIRTVADPDLASRRGPDHAWDFMIWDNPRLFHGCISDKDRAMQVYQAWNARVERIMQKHPGQLLVFNVAKGWAPLCRFLGVRQPDKPFPVRNRTWYFREKNRLPALA